MATFKRLLSFLRPYRRAVIVTALLAICAMAMTVAIPWLVGSAVDAIRLKNEPELLPLALAVLGAGVLRLGLSASRRLTAGRVSLGVEYDLRNQVYRHLQTLELAFFDQQQSGQLMSRATVDLQAIRFFLGYGLIFIVQEVFTIVLAGAVMFAIHPSLAALALAPTPLIVLTAARYGRRSRPALQEVQQRIAELTADAEENISGIRVVKAFACEPEQLKRFRGSVGKVFEQSMISTRLRALYGPMLAFIPNIGLAVVLLYGGRQTIDGNITLGQFVQFYSYLMMLVFPMRRLGMSLGMAQRAVASGNRLFQILDRKPRITSKPSALPLPSGPGCVEFQNVSFAYDGRRESLSEISLKVEAGRAVALVGPTGSGKTTLVMLVPRLYDPERGRVLLDGSDIRDVDVASLRRQVALVADDSFLFSASVRDNIAYGRPEASFDEIRAAATHARAHSFIRGLPDGYETVIGERGLTLSGGQRQRIAIARALLTDPRVLILDDATSSVDVNTEGEIRAALREVMKNRTTFIIAHRLSTLALADEIVVIDRGRIVARGTHDELVEQQGLYRKIAEREAPWIEAPAAGQEEAVGL